MRAAGTLPSPAGAGPLWLGTTPSLCRLSPDRPLNAFRRTRLAVLGLR